MYTGDTIASKDASVTTTEKVADAKGVGGHLASGRSRHGQGEIKYDSGAFYVGGWSRGKREGTGKFVFACGDVYEGQWKNGMYHGVGKYTSADSDEYEGEWVNDKMEGHGRYHYRNSGDVYEGDWIGGVSHGIGKFIQASTGETFMGEYERGELKGKTKLDKASMLNGTDEFGKRIKFFTASLTGERAIRAGLGNFRYSGETIAHGEALTIQSKERVEGAPGGRLQGTSRGRLASGRVRHGYGEIKYDSGSAYVGEWENDTRVGTGKYFFACGDVYEGQWKNGMYHGVGKYTSADSDEYEGEWAYDKMEGALPSLRSAAQPPCAAPSTAQPSPMLSPPISPQGTGVTSSRRAAMCTRAVSSRASSTAPVSTLRRRAARRSRASFSQAGCVPATRPRRECPLWTRRSPRKWSTKPI